MQSICRGARLSVSSRGKKKVVVGVNESFRTADHDFSEVSLIPDTIFVQDIPKP